MDRLQLIQTRLQQSFSPTTLDVLDDSAKHIGHVGSAHGAGHFTIKIAANCFKDKSRLEVHRAIYAVLNDLIPEQIHALRIIVL